VAIEIQEGKRNSRSINGHDDDPGYDTEREGGDDAERRRKRMERSGKVEAMDGICM
jgi:hypothetical protein